MALTLNPATVLYLVGVAVLYARAVRVLRRRGQMVAGWQQGAWYGGLGLTAIALLGPPDALGDELLTMHMVQHLLIADLAAPLLIAGLRNPVLGFFLPRAVLVPLARSRLRRAFRVMRRPWIALPIFVALLYGWHIRVLFEGALRSDWVHALQHLSFVGGSLLVWWAVLEPKRRRMPGELWKIGHIFAARLFSAMLGMGLVFSRSPWYAGVYGDRPSDYGLSPLADQQTAGGIMMSLDVLVIVFALTLFFWRAAADFDRATDRQGSAVTPDRLSGDPPAAR